VESLVGYQWRIGGELTIKIYAMVYVVSNSMVKMQGEKWDT
jgi:hypothetical protein